MICALRHQLDKRPQNVHVFARFLSEEILSILLDELKTVFDADLEKLLALWRLGELRIECSLNYIEDCFRFSRHFQGRTIEALHLRPRLQGLESSIAVWGGLLLWGLLGQTFLFSFDTQQIVPLLRLHSLIPLNLTFNILETLQNLGRQFARIMPELHKISKRCPCSRTIDVSLIIRLLVHFLEYLFKPLPNNSSYHRHKLLPHLQLFSRLEKLSICSSDNLNLSFIFHKLIRIKKLVEVLQKLILHV